MTDGKLHEDVGEIKGKLDFVIKLLERGANRMDDHGTRIVALEKNQHWRSRLAAVLGAMAGGAGIHFTRVIVAAVVLSALLVSPAPGATTPKVTTPPPLVDQRRAAILKFVMAIGVLPGAEIPVGSNVYVVEAVDVLPDYTVVIRTRLIRSGD